MISRNELDIEDARSVPKYVGRNGLYKTIVPCWQEVLQRPPVFWAGSRSQSAEYRRRCLDTRRGLS